MSVSTPTPSPIGISPPLELEDSAHHGTLIAVSASISICLVLVAIGIRVWVRMKVGLYWIDDYTFLAASFFTSVEAAVVYFALSRGFGRPLDTISSENLIGVQKARYVAEMLYIICMFFSKCSTAFFLLRVTLRHAHIVVAWSTIGFITLWAISSALIVLIRCRSSHPWDDTSGQCTMLALKWKYICPVDIITELSLFGVSVYVFWNLRMPKRLRTVVIAAFGARCLPVIIIVIMRLNYIRRELSSTEPTFLAAYTASVSQFEIGYSILATVVPCLKPFIVAYDSPQDTKNYRNKDPERKTFKLSTFHSSKAAHLAKRAGFEIFDDSESERKLLRTRKDHFGSGGLFPKEHDLKLRPECAFCEARVEGNSGGFSEEGRDSLRMVIIKDVAWRVDYEIRDPGNDPPNV